MKFRKVRVKETVERRCLGALRFVDNATRNVVHRPLNISAPGLKFSTNLSHMQVITYAKGFERYLTAFDAPPNQPVAESKEFSLAIQDPLGKYLPRTYTLKLPRRSQPQGSNNIFEPLNIRLFSAANADLSLNWSVIRVSVYDAKDLHNEVPLPGALLRVTYGQDSLVASGLSDKRGEALIIVPGIPITTFVSENSQPNSGDESEIEEPNEGRATDRVVELETSAQMEIIVAPKAPWPVDPEKLENNINLWRRQLKLKKSGPFISQVELTMKTGQTQHIKLFVKMSQAT